MDARIRPIGSETGPGMATAIGLPRLLNKRGCGRLAAAASVTQDLFVVADAIDRAGPVIRNKQGAILGEHDIRRTAEIALVALEPA
jgi:hypothetical protein